MARHVFRVILALFFIVAGVNHFVSPRYYLAMMPPWLPWPEGVNWISGAAEILGGVGVFLPATRRAAGWGLLALLVAVFPANLHVALHGWPGVHIPEWVLWARLPLQLPFMAWVWWTCLAPNSKSRGVGP